MQVQDIVNALERNEFSVRYYGPSSHVIRMNFEDDPYSGFRYIVNDDGGADSDYGCIEVQFYDFGNVRFDWYDGAWKTDDVDIGALLKEGEVQKVLSMRFSDIAIDIGPKGERPDDVEVWKKIISRCLTDNDSLVNQLDVMMDFDNANSANPALFPCVERNEWDSYVDGTR